MLTLIAALLTPAHAAGYYFSDTGVRSFSRGGAYVAGADDLLAVQYNPAALTRLQDGRFTLDVAGVGQKVTFDRADVPEGGVDGEDLVNDPIENSAPTYFIPHLGVAHSLGIPNTTLAFAFYPPYAPDLSYPEDGPQRYSLIDTVVIQTFTGLSAAHEFADWVSVGAGVHWNVLYIEQDLKISVLSEFQVEKKVEDPAYDIKFHLDAADWSGIGWNAGLLVEPPNELFAVGFMVQAPVAFHAEGTMEVDFRGNKYHDELTIIKDDTASDTTVTMDIDMPLILKAGALVRPTDKLEVEVAAVYEGWSAIQEVIVNDVSIPVVTTLSSEEDPLLIEGPITLPAGYADTWSLRLGGQYVFADKYTVRAGGMWEQSAIPSKSKGVNLVDGDKFGYGVGGSWRFHRRLEADVGLAQSFLPREEITDSELHQIAADPFTGEIMDGVVVGNGVYESRITIFGAGLNYYFGKNAGKKG